MRRSRLVALDMSVVHGAAASERCTGAAAWKASAAISRRLRSLTADRADARRRARTSRFASVWPSSSLEGDDRRCPAGTRRPAPSRAPPTTSSASDASPSDWASSSQRRTVRAPPRALVPRAGYRPADDSEHDQRRRRDRGQLEGQASSRRKRIPADCGLSIAVVQPGAVEFANATTRPVEPSRPRVPESTPVPFLSFASNAEFVGSGEARQSQLLAGPIDDDESLESEVGRSWIGTATGATPMPLREHRSAGRSHRVSARPSPQRASCRPASSTLR